MAFYIGLAAGGVVLRAAALGTEFTLTRNLRIAPFGNREGIVRLYCGPGRPCGPSNLYRLPHYHRRILGPDGNTIPGGFPRHHRPYEPSGLPWFRRF